MPDTTINGITISVDADGYLTNHPQWSRELADGLAAAEGIALTDAH